MLSITAYLDFVNALYHLVWGFLLAKSGEQRSDDIFNIAQRAEFSAGFLRSLFAAFDEKELAQF